MEKEPKTFADMQAAGATFAELVAAFPDHFDSQDCRPARSIYPEKNWQEIMPDCVRTRLAEIEAERAAEASSEM
jgi:hypothetical protein